MAKPKSPRRTALDLIASYSAQDDMKMATRIYIESNISPAAFNEAWKSGKRLKRIINEQQKAKK